MSGVLDNVKVGDKLIMTSRWNRTILTVEKAQKNFVIAKGYKFRKSNGTLVSSDCWTSASAEIATEEDLEDFRKEVRRQRGKISKVTHWKPKPNLPIPSLPDTNTEKK